MKRAAWPWSLVLLPGVVATLTEGAQSQLSLAAALAPGMLLFAAVLWAHLPRPLHPWGRLVKELRQLRAPALWAMAGAGLLAVPAASDLLGPACPATSEFSFCLLAPLSVAAAFGPELEGPLLLDYFARPLSLRRLLAEKWALAALVVTAATAQQVALSSRLALPLGAAAFALGVVPLLLARLKHVLLSALLSAAASVALVGQLLDRVHLSEGAALAVVAAASAAAALAFWRKAGGLARVPAAEKLLGGLFSLRGRQPAWRALVFKELQFHSGPLLLVAVMCVARLAQHLFLPTGAIAAQTTSMLLGLVAAALSGVTPILGEHRFGTALLDRSVVPTSLVWGCKLSVSFGASLFCGALMPMALIGIVSLRGATFLCASSLLVTAVGLVASALVRDLSRALVATIGGALVLLAVFTVPIVIAFSRRHLLPAALLEAAARLSPTAASGLETAALALPMVLALLLATRLAHDAWLLGGFPPPRRHLPGALALLATSALCGQLSVLLIR